MIMKLKLDNKTKGNIILFPNALIIFARIYPGKDYRVSISQIGASNQETPEMTDHPDYPRD